MRICRSRARGRLGSRRRLFRLGRRRRLRGLRSGRRGVALIGRAFGEDNLLAGEQNRAHGKKSGEATEEVPLEIVEAARRGSHLRASAGVPFLRGILALATSSGGLRGADARKADGQCRLRGERIMSKTHHALFLAGRSQAVTGYGDARGNDDEKLHARIGGGQFESGGIVGVREFIRKTNIRLSGTKRIGDGEAALALFDGGLVDRHAHGSGRGDLTNRAVFRNCEVKVAFGTEVRGGRLRRVLNGILLGADESVALWL